MVTDVTGPFRNRRTERNQWGARYENGSSSHSSVVPSRRTEPTRVMDPSPWGTSAKRRPSPATALNRSVSENAFQTACRIGGSLQRPRCDHGFHGYRRSIHPVGPVPGPAKTYRRFAALWSTLAALCGLAFCSQPLSRHLSSRSRPRAPTPFLRSTCEVSRRPWIQHPEIYLEPAETPQTWDYNLGLWFNYAHRPITLRDDADEVAFAVIDHQLSADFIANVGFDGEIVARSRFARRARAVRR